jgi:hypothetical protein
MKTLLRTTLHTALGIALLLHGLANAVFPLRGVGTLPAGDWSLPLTLLYVVAIVGFVAAGLGVLGVRPLTRLVLSTAFAGGAASLIAHAVLGDRDLWLGMALSAALPFLTARWVWLTATRTVPANRSVWRRTVDAAGLAFLLWVAASAVLWPWHRTWGATETEWTMALPGDRAARTPRFEILHGVSIDAAPGEVWPWLVQLGQDRAGFYSYERLERLFGVDVRNVAQIRPEWQTRHTGDFVPATQSGYLGGLFGDQPGWTVEHLDRNRAMVLRYWGAFVLVPDRNGGTRFLIRSTISNDRIPAWAAALNFTAFELPHFIMQRRMMLNIKALTERVTSG